MVRKVNVSGQKAELRGEKRDCPEWEEIKDLEARQKELKRRLRKVTDPLERRRLEQEIKVLDWRLQRLRVRSRAAGS